MAKIAELNDFNFENSIKESELPLLVDFWAEWCGPCKMIAPILEEISSEREGKIQIAKLNVDTALAAARRYEVMSIPTLILFKDGKPIRRIVGAKSKSSLLRELDPDLS
ncbi:MAG: thioredoxin [Acidimicrobiaceae bacterium]|nr:thioredoxin [Acidimicrobiaceae bacterium]